MELTNLQQEAQRLGYPSTLFGLTPDEQGYWYEPGLPFLIEGAAPLDRMGGHLVLQFAGALSQCMAPRFPKGCVVNIAPIYQRANLVVGRVYFYRYLHPDTGEECWDMGRLERIGDAWLWARADNEPARELCWRLRSKQSEAVWDVYEVTHYVQYPWL